MYLYSYQTKAGRNNGTYHDKMGYGLVDAEKAIKKILPTISSMSAPSVLCSSSNKTNPSQNFTMSYKRKGFKWNKSSNLNFNSFSSDSTNVTVSWNGDVYSSGPGPGWVSITLNGLELTRYNLPWVGAPSSISISGPTYFPEKTEVKYSVVYNSLSYPTGFNWYSTPSYGSTLYSYGNYVNAFFSEGDYQIACVLTNVCGSKDTGMRVYAYGNKSSSNTGPKIYPNPVSDILFVEISPPADSKVQITYDIRLIDVQGNVQRQSFTKGGTVQFNVRNLPDGFYYIHIYNGISEKPEVYQIVIER